MLNTNGTGGRPLKKNILVYTNDPNHTSFKLVIYGEVQPFADIKPASVSLRGFAGEKIQQKVRIVPREEYPFNIVSSRAHVGRNIRFKVKENWLGSEYIVTVENLKMNKGGYGDTIILETDSEIKPEIRIPVYGRILVKQ